MTTNNTADGVEKTVTELKREYHRKYYRRNRRRMREYQDAFWRRKAIATINADRQSQKTHNVRPGQSDVQTHVQRQNNDTGIVNIKRQGKYTKNKLTQTDIVTSHYNIAPDKAATIMPDTTPDAHITQIKGNG